MADEDDLRALVTAVLAKPSEALGHYAIHPVRGASDVSPPVVWELEVVRRSAVRFRVTELKRLKQPLTDEVNAVGLDEASNHLRH